MFFLKVVVLIPAIYILEMYKREGNLGLWHLILLAMIVVGMAPGIRDMGGWFSMSEHSLARATICGHPVCHRGRPRRFAVARDPAVGVEVMALFRDQVASQILTDSPADPRGRIFFNNATTCALLFLGEQRWASSRC